MLLLKKISNKNFKQIFKPWISKGILKSLHKSNEIHSRYLLAKDFERKNLLYRQFKVYRNLLTTN